MIDVTVGIPVHNGADLIGEALDCLTNQTYRKIRILVSDNASTDNTAEIVRSKARDDKRIELIEQGTNLGPVGNFRFLAEAADTPFFAWRAHDDLSELDFISNLRTTLIANPPAALCAPSTIIRRPKRDRHQPNEIESGVIADWRAMPRARAGWFYGLYRTSAAQSGSVAAHERYPHVWGWDYVVLLSTLLNGGIIGNNNAGFIHRLTANTGQYNFDKKHLRRIFSSFYYLGDKLAAEHGLEGLDRQRFRLNLLKLITKRVTRWQRLI